MKVCVCVNELCNLFKLFDIWIINLKHSSWKIPKKTAKFSVILIHFNQFNVFLDNDIVLLVFSLRILRWCLKLLRFCIRAVSYYSHNRCTYTYMRSSIICYLHRKAFYTCTNRPGVQIQSNFVIFFVWQKQIHEFQNLKKEKIWKIFRYFPIFSNGKILKSLEEKFNLLKFKIGTKIDISINILNQNSFLRFSIEYHQFYDDNFKCIKIEIWNYVRCEWDRQIWIISNCDLFIFPLLLLSFQFVYACMPINSHRTQNIIQISWEKYVFFFFITINCNKIKYHIIRNNFSE